jgi:nucleoside-diphosphate-sugar epimerase
MKILVTGAKGFIGSHICERLNKNPYYVIPWDRDNGDLKAVTKFPLVDCVIHLAAMVTTSDYYTKAFDVLQNNIIPTLNLLNFYRQQEHKPLFIYTGTPESYAGATDLYNYKIPTDENAPFVISDPKNLRWSYAGSKGLGEQAVIASGLDYIIVRPHNTYGPGQVGHFVSEFVERAKNKDYTVHGSDNTRSWLYIDDFCDAFIKLMNCKNAINETVNIGSADEYPVIDLAKIILQKMNIDEQPIPLKGPKGSVSRRQADISKLKRLTGWEQKISLEKGLELTVESLCK